MAKSQMQAIADSISEYYLKAEIANQDPEDIAIQLLTLPTEQAKRMLEGIHPGDRRERIYTSLNLLSQKIQVLLESP